MLLKPKLCVQARRNRGWRELLGKLQRTFLPPSPPSYFFIKFNVSQNGKNSDKILNIVKTCKLHKTSQSLLLFVTLRLIPACNTSGTILESYFEQRSPTRRSEQPMQLGCGESCEPPGRDRIHNPGRVH